MVGRGDEDLATAAFKRTTIRFTVLLRVEEIPFLIGAGSRS
jgi:hypothetical protein